MTSDAPPAPERLPLRHSGAGRALVIRIGALGDLLLTRRLTYSLSLDGLQSTLLAPTRHASLLKGDSWIDAVLDSESPGLGSAFAGEWPGPPGAFELAVVISDSEDLGHAARVAAASMIQVAPAPSSQEVSIALQWAAALSSRTAAFAGNLPQLALPPAAGPASGTTFIHPGSGSPRKNWPIDLFLELSLTLREAGHRVVWIRGPAEKTFPDEAAAFPLLDQPSLATLGSALARSRLFVGNDSGVSHLAAAVGAPTLTLFGPTSDVVWRPDGPRVATVRSATFRMEDLGLDDVLAGIDRLAGRHAPRPLVL